ncbi:MAG: adenosylmethionine decarboxylase [Gemmatimonadales bacterium]
MSSAGISYLLELYDCPSEILNDETYINAMIGEAVAHANATLLHQVSHQFSPQGATALALLAESHISIHTWPELGYAAVDIFTCGRHAMPDQACEYLVTALRAGDHTVQRVKRGVGLGIDASQLRPKPAAEPAALTL